MIRYIFLGILFYLGFLFVTLPADLGYGYWKKHMGQRTQVVLTGVKGSVWHGEAASAVINGQRFQGLKWKFKPLRLLTAKAELDLEFTVPDGFGKGQAGYSFFSGYYVKNVESWVPLTFIARFVNLAALRPGGKLNINLSALNFDGTTLTTADGSLSWLDAEVSFFQPVALGNFQVDLSTTDKGITGVLKDKGGPLQANATLLLNPAGEYNLNGEILLRDKSRNDLRQALQAMGRPNAKGAIPLKQKGKLSQLGIM